MKKRFFFLLLLVSWGFLYSQKCDLVFLGQVYDLHDKLPLEGVRVTVIETSREVMTNAEGKFGFPALCKGSYTLLLEHPSCSPTTVKAKVPSSLMKSFFLEHHLTELEEIIVADKNLKKNSATGVETALSAEEIARYSTQNLGDALNALSGVNTLKTGSNLVKPVVHGLSGSRVVIVNDGNRLQDHEWGADHAPSISISEAENIQLIKGPSALRYGGDALGGVIKILPKKLSINDSLFGKVSLGYQDNGRQPSAIVKLHKTTAKGYFISSNANLRLGGDLSAPDYVLTNTGVNEKQLGIRFGRNIITQKWAIGYTYFQKTVGILSAAHIGNVGDLYRAISSGVPFRINPFSRTINSPKQHTQHHTLKLNYQKTFDNGNRIETAYAFQSNKRQEFDVRRGVPSTVPALDIHLQTHSFLVDLLSAQNETMSWAVGTSLSFQDNFSDPDTGVKRLIPDYFRTQTGAYLTATYFPSNNFQLEGGIRYDLDWLNAKKFYRISDWEERGYDQRYAATIIRRTNTSQYLTEQNLRYGNFSASIGLHQTLSDAIAVNLNYGLINRSPNPSELFSDGLHHALATIELGALGLNNETAQKTLLSIAYKKNGLKWMLSGYFNAIEDYILLEPAGIDQTVRGAFQVWQYRQTAATLFGLDFDWEWKPTPSLQWTAKTTWVKGEEKNNARPLIDIPPFNQQNSLRWSLPKKPWSLALHSNYVAEQKNYPNNNFFYDLIEAGEISRVEVDASTPPKAYHLLGGEIRYTFKQRPLSVFLTLENINNTSFRNYLNRMRYFADEPGRRIILQLNYTF